MLDFFKDVLSRIYDVKGIIEWGGVFAISVIVFVETGLFVGFFLPGDSLLVTAGILSSAGILNVYHLLIFVSLSAILGDQVGYFIGHKIGKQLFSKEDSIIFKKKHIDRAKAFYEKHGPKTIVLARFIPIVRTFAPAVAGAAEMEYKTFVSYNILGGLLWVFSTVLGGYFLGSLIPDIEKKLHIVIAAVIVLSFIPIGIEYWKSRKEKDKKENKENQ